MHRLTQQHLSVMLWAATGMESSLLPSKPMVLVAAKLAPSAHVALFPRLQLSSSLSLVRGSTAAMGVCLHTLQAIVSIPVFSDKSLPFLAISVLANSFCHYLFPGMLFVYPGQKLPIRIRGFPHVAIVCSKSSQIIVILHPAGLNSAGQRCNYSRVPLTKSVDSSIPDSGLQALAASLPLQTAATPASQTSRVHA